ncbi:MAG: DUF4959 domain-containing protein [Bacteroidales bacterium]|nr:DUF4959 domain-containing protein [Bacteroidales bacterium]
MKKTIFILIAALALASCSDKLGGRIDQPANVPVPGKVTVTGVRSIPGGAVIKVQIPDDENLKGIVAEYERNGAIVNAKISRYVDSLTVEGFADTKPHKISLYAFNVNEERSEGVDISIDPLTPAIQTVQTTMTGSYGGVKVRVEGNESHSDLAICILRDPDPSHYGKPKSELRLTEVTTLFTASNNISLSRRGIEPVEALFGMYVRDHWGNMSDTTYYVLTPLVEVKLDTVLTFKNAAIADDNCPSGNTSYYPIESLWDGSGLSEVPHFFASTETNPSPCWLTIDLGLGQRTASLSRITTLPRIGYVIFGGGAVRDYEFWGSLGSLNDDGTYSKPKGQVVPENEHGFDDTWFCLGKFTQAKPSGYLDNGLPGTITAEDRDTYNAGNDFELNSDEYPRCNDPLRYLRVVFANTFTTFELGHNATNRQVQTGEVTPYGMINE